MTYNKKIIIQQCRETADEIGQITEQWTEVIKCWANVNCTGGKEYYAAAQTNSQNDMIFRIRYSRSLSGLTSANSRILYENRTYNIKHIDDYMEKHMELVIRAEAVN